MGYSTDLFLDHDQAEAFTCSICQEILQQPYHVGDTADHVFCHSCLQAHIGSSVAGRNALCPLCRATIRPEQLRPGAFIKRQIDRLRVRCGTEECRWTGTLADASAHEGACQYRMMDCPNRTAHGAICEWEGAQAKLEVHLESCGGATVECPRPACGVSLARRQLLGHEKTCEGFQCHYVSVDNCPFVGRQAATRTHEKYCRGLHESLASIPRLQQQLELERSQREALEARLRILDGDSQDGHRDPRSSDAILPPRPAKATSPSPLPSSPPPAPLIGRPFNLTWSTTSLEPLTFIGPKEEEVTLKPSTTSFAAALLSKETMSSSPPPPPGPPTPFYPLCTTSSTAPAIPPTIRPFDLTPSAHSPSFSTTAPPKLPPFGNLASFSTLPSGRPFNLTGAPIPPVLVGRPFKLTADASRRRPRPATNPRATEGNEEEEDDLGTWERGGEKRPRFDGAYPREWTTSG